MSTQVMCFMGCKWGRDVDYMFFRNANTNSEKLCEKIYRPTEPGDEAHSYCAYCCQCSWTDVKVGTFLTNKLAIYR